LSRGERIETHAVVSKFLLRREQSSRSRRGLKKPNLVGEKALLAALPLCSGKIAVQHLNFHLKSAFAMLEARFAAWENSCGTKRA